MSTRPETFASGRSPLPARPRSSWLLDAGSIHSAADIRTLPELERTSGEAAGCTGPTRLSRSGNGIVSTPDRWGNRLNHRETDREPLLQPRVAMNIKHR